MKHKSGKAFYLLLTSIVGILLFVLLQRAALTIWVVLSSYSLSGLVGKVSDSTIQMIDGYSMLLALFFGAWYGIWVGLHWHEELYGDDRAPRMLHRFLPHSMRPESYSERVDSPVPTSMVADLKPVARKPRTGASKKTTSKSSVMNPPEIVAWSFDDLAEEKAKRKIAPKKLRTTRAKKVNTVTVSEPGSVTIMES